MHQKKPKPSVFGMLKPYARLIAGLSICAILANAVSLAVPKLISSGIDNFGAGTLDMKVLVIQFSAVALAVFLFTYFQSLFQAYASEKIARDLRGSLAARIADMTFLRIEAETPAKLLTNLTSDIDAIKQFVSMAVANIVASIVVILGASALLLYIDWRLALAVLAIVPLIGLVFFAVFSKLGPLFRKAQEAVDRLNAVIAETIVGAALVRVLDAGGREKVKFSLVSAEARDNSLRIVRLFSFIIPTVGAIANLATLVILALGGWFVIGGDMTIGDFAAFNGYVFMLIFPIIMLGFISSVVSRAQASYERVFEVISAKEEGGRGTVSARIRGDIAADGLTVSYADKDALKNVSFTVRAGTRTAVIGPTAAGKTQLLYALIGLIEPAKGVVRYDGRPLSEYKRESLHEQVAIVFQDSVMFNMSLGENVAFSLRAESDDVSRAIEAAELSGLVESLPQGLDALVSERGTSLSGGQKQRVMLARALALNPRVLLLDDFTARVDAETEKRILANVERMYPGITIVSVTQKVRSAEAFDQIVLLMEGEVLATGTHAELLASSPEYAQIVESQKSTETYEIHA